MILLQTKVSKVKQFVFENAVNSYNQENSVEVVVRFLTGKKVLYFLECSNISTFGQGTAIVTHFNGF